MTEFRSMSRDDTDVVGLHHVALVVPDLESARKFYESVFALDLVMVEVWTQGHPEIDESVGLRDSAARGYMLKGANAYLELWHYESPESTGRASDRGANDYGLAHVCFEVGDFDAVLSRLIRAGGSSMGQPPVGPNADSARMQYCRDPFGNIVELLELAADQPLRIRWLAEASAPSTRSSAASTYHYVENGRYMGQRDKADLVTSRPVP